MNVKAKKMLSLVLAFVMLLGMLPAAVFAVDEAAGRFVDVPANAWYNDAVQYVYENGLMDGFNENHFAPGAMTTRSMVVTVLHRMEGEPAGVGVGFTDVEDGQWYTEAVLWAQANGIVEGDGDGAFRPHSPMTREEMMAVFYRYSQYKGYDVSEAAALTVFTDSVKIHSYAEDAMSWAVSVGLIKGFPDGTIRPQADSERAQLAIVLMRFCGFCGIDVFCTVEFVTNGGNTIAPRTIPKGAVLSTVADPMKVGSAFLGWYRDPAYTHFVDLEAFQIIEDMTLYARWLNVADETDSDQDEIEDELELLLGLDPTTSDTDGDGLNDYMEIDQLYLSPLSADTDNNGVHDGDEDNDDDGLTNLEEAELGTDPTNPDTDGDLLIDGNEVTTHYTDPEDADSDDDGVFDGREIAMGTDPLTPQEQFEVHVSSSSEDSVTASVDIILSGEQVETLKVDRVIHNSMFTPSMPGYLGSAYDFSVDGSFEQATIRFSFDPTYLEDPEFDPVIFYFNEQEQILEPLDTVINGNEASAVVTHFSTYVLINRRIHYEAFAWEDVWDANGSFSGVEIVLVIDDSGSMSSNDGSFERLSVAQTLIDALPDGSKIGVVRFANSTTLLTPELVTDREAAKALLTRAYFASSGGTNMYDAINKSLDLFQSSEENILRTMVVISDGDSSDVSRHSSTIDAAVAANVRIYTVGLGYSTSYFDRYLKPLAGETNGAFYLASNADSLASIYKDINKRIDLETDTDSDGIPDYYEEHLVSFDGSRLILDKYNPDTDGDGITDGDEVVLKFTYNDDRTKVCVTGFMKSHPAQADSDGDGLLDNAPSYGYKTGARGVERYVAAPQDPQPMIYNGPAGMWKAHIEAQQDPSRVAGEYIPNVDGWDSIPDAIGLPEWADELIVDATLYLESIVSSGWWEAAEVEKYIKKVCTTIKFFFGREAFAAAGAYLLNFIPDNLNIAYHSQPDTWQRDFGYNNFFDSVFRIGSNMDVLPVRFSYGQTEYRLWMWKGDYWNLQSGAEIGLYRYDHSSSGQNHFDTIDFELPMTLSLYNYYAKGDVDNIFNWAPSVEQWWVTGFEPDFGSPDPNVMVCVSSIDFTGHEELYDALKQAAARDYFADRYLMFNSNGSDPIVWVMWD